MIIITIMIKITPKTFPLFIIQLSESVARRCFVKCVFVRISQNSQENTCATLLKKRFWHICFHVNFARFLRTPFRFLEHLRWLFLSFPEKIDNDFQPFTIFAKNFIIDVQLGLKYASVQNVKLPMVYNESLRLFGNCQQLITAH